MRPPADDLREPDASRMLSQLGQRASEFLPYWALRKLRVALEGIGAHRLRRSNRPALPKMLIVDPGNLCNLKCPLCPTGAGNLDYPRSFMTLETFQSVLDTVPALKALALFNWGEPLLHPEIIRFIELASARGIYTAIHTNFSLDKSDDYLERLVRSGLSQLTVSLDGASQESFVRYRVGGDYQTVFSNLARVAEIKRKLGRKKPRIIWKFVVNRFNEDEVRQARARARSLGVEFLIEPISLGDDLIGVQIADSLRERERMWLPQNQQYVHPSYRNGALENAARSDAPCPHLFSIPVVNPDGRISPCCYAAGESAVFGDLRRSSFAEIWWNEAYQYSRSLFTGKRHSGSVAHTVCSNCSNYKKHAHSLEGG
jgi:radical SAM protein with 4Fe4S-binding SPASM domain